MASQFIKLPVSGGGGGPGAGVDSFNGRTGVVVSQAGDYSAGIVSNVPSGSISSTNVQAAINELDSDVQFLYNNPAPISRGGTAATTAPIARVNLGIDQRSTFSNANYAVLSTDRSVAQIGTMTAPRTVTLPAASSVNAGQTLFIYDQSGTVSTTNTLTIQAFAGNNINGASTTMIRAPYGIARLISDGVSSWNDGTLGVSRGGTGLTTLPVNGQLLIGNSTTNAYSLAQLVAGTGIAIVNNPGGIQIVNSEVAAFVNIDGGAANSSYIAGDAIDAGNALG